MKYRTNFITVEKMIYAYRLNRTTKQTASLMLITYASWSLRNYLA